MISCDENNRIGEGTYHANHGLHGEKARGVEQELGEYTAGVVEVTLAYKVSSVVFPRNSTPDEEYYVKRSVPRRVLFSAHVEIVLGEPGHDRLLLVQGKCAVEGLEVGLHILIGRCLVW